LNQTRPPVFALFERAGTLRSGLFDCLDAARAPRLNCGSLPVGALNFVKVHNAHNLLCFVLNFFVTMSHKLGNDHTTACQEFFNCDVLFHVFLVGFIYAIGDATTFAVDFHNDQSIDCSSRVGQTRRVAGEVHIGLAAPGVRNVS
jgi:hypothetical protein